MPCEIKELVINTTINQTDSSHSVGNDSSENNSFDESYLRKLVADEINKARGKIIQDTVEVFNENNRLNGQR